MADLGDLSGGRREGPLANDLKLVEQIRISQRGMTLGRAQAVAAKVIGTAFEQGDLCLGTEGPHDQWKIFVKELVLEMAGAGGKQGFSPREDDWHEIGKTLAHASAGLADQRPAVVDGAMNCLGQGLLLRARSEALQQLGERPIAAQDVSYAERSIAGVDAGHKQVLD